MVEKLNHPYLEPKPSTRPGSDALPSLQGVRVLIVEDIEDNRHLISRFLTKRGATVVTANDGKEGMLKALSEHFDVVLMDLEMPVMDGYEATRELRKRNYQRPILALTAHSLGDIKKKTLEAGYTGQLLKPINSKDLIETVSRYAKA